MSQVIPQRSLRNDNAKVIDAVVAGQSFIVTRNGSPVAEIRPIQSHRSTVVCRNELEALIGVGPPIDAQQLREDLDRTIDPFA